MAEIQTALSNISEYVMEVKTLTKTYDPTVQSILDSLKKLEPDKGYWIKVSQDCTLNFYIMNKLIVTTVLMMSLAIKAQDTVTSSTVTTTVTDVVTSTSATLNSKIILNSGETITKKGFVYSLSAKGLITGGANVDKAIIDREIIHRGIDFSCKNIRGLIADKQYFYKAYTTNNMGRTSYGDIQSFTTKRRTPCDHHPWGEVKILTTSTTMSGEVTINGSSAVEGDEVSAFIDGELRANLPVIIDGDGKSYIALVIGGNLNNEIITFKVWDKSECEEVPVEYTLASEPGTRFNGLIIAAVSITTGNEDFKHYSR